MIPNLTMIVAIGAFFSAGVFLLLARSLTRVIIGVLLISNGANLLLLSAGGGAGGVPLLGRGPVAEMADPLPQALILTAIVITFGITAFMLALAHRSWQLFGHDEVQDDIEDRQVQLRAEHDRADESMEQLTDPHTDELVADTDFDADSAVADPAPEERS